jgi:uncharacterized membrane protein
MTTPQPGWYDDPEDPNAERYWDGQDWTPQRRRKSASGHTPPPPPSYSAPPPQYSPPPVYATPPPPPGYAQPPAGYPQYAGGPQYPGVGVPFFSVGDAFNWAWNKFSKNAAALIISMLVYGVGLAVLGIVLSMISAAFDVALFTGAVSTSTSTGYTDSTAASDSAAAAGAGVGFVGTIVVTALIGFVFLVAAIYVQAAFVSGNLAIADGRPVDIGSYLRPPRNFGSVIIAALLVGVGTVIGSILCVIPGLLFAFFAAYTIPYVIDRSLSPVDALKASFSTIKQHFGSALLSYIVVLVVMFIGGLIIVVGALISIPTAMLILTYTYRRLSGGNLAPITP